MNGTLTYSDLYGPKTPTGGAAAQPDTEKASGGLPAGSEKAPGMAIGGMIALLVVLRVLVEINPAVG